MSKLKRHAAPKFWPIERKTKKYSVNPSPGPHSKEKCMPLGVILRDVMKAADNMKEAREILLNGFVKVNGVKRSRQNFPVGLMDILSVGDQEYRMLVSKNGLYLQKIEGKETGVRLCRVEDKHWIGGKLQINMHDGTNMISNVKCSTGDVLVIGLPEMNVKEVLKLEKNSVVLVTAGNNSGDVGKIKEIIVTRSAKPNQAVVSLGNRSVSLPRDFVFVVGKEKPVISVGV